MTRHNLIIAFRQLRKKVMLSSFTIFGLAIGIAASILLAKYISWHWNFDRFHTNAGQIVRIQTDLYKEGQRQTESALTYSGVPVYAREKLAGVEDYVRLARWIANDVVLNQKENIYRGDRFYFADPSFFNIFSFALLQGDKNRALSEPNSLVITESTAKRLFGEENPIGKEILFENFKPFVVTAVASDPPEQSHIQFDLLASYSTLDNWGFEVFSDNQLDFAFVYAYLKLLPQVNPDVISQQLNQVISGMRDQSLEQSKLTLQRFTDIHLYSDLSDDVSAPGPGNNIWILTGIAILILILGWVNHFNLFSADTLEQITSLRIRKVVGAGTRDLFSQLFTRSALNNILALFIGIVFARFLEPLLVNILGTSIGSLSVFDFNRSNPASYLLALLIIGTSLTGLLGAIGLSRIEPSRLYNKQNPNLIRGFGARQFLLIIQFAIIVSLLSGTRIVYMQGTYMREKDLGMDLTNVIAIPGPLGTRPDEMTANFSEFKNQVHSIPGVTALSISHRIPGDELELIADLKIGSQHFKSAIYRNYGNIDYFDIYKIPKTLKQDKINTADGDVKKFLINETTMNLVGVEKEADLFNRPVQIWDRADGEIVGIVKNHHHRSLHHPLSAMIYDLSNDDLMTDGYYSIKLEDGADRKNVIASIGEIYRKSFPNTVFNVIDVENQFEAQYLSDHYFKNLNLLFTGLAVLIACLGLLGLLMISIQTRLKELSIRKVLGSSTFGIFLLLSRDFIILMALAIITAIPATYYLMSRWLENFNHRINISWGVFVFSATIAITLVFLTIALQGWRVSKLNPAEILKEE